MDRVRAWVQRWLPSDAVLAEREFARRQRALVLLLSLHVPFLVAVGLNGGWSVGHVALEVSPIALLALYGWTRRGSRVTRAVVTTTGLVASSSMLVHATGGLTESHFHFFVVVATVALYEMWAPFLVCLGWVLVHHGSVGQVAPEEVYGNPAAIERPLQWALLHGTYVLLAATAAMAAWKFSQEGSRRAQRLLAATRDGVYEREAGGLISFANQTVLSAVGASEAAVVGRRDHLVLGHPQALADCELCAALDAGPVDRLEVVLHVGGTDVPVEVSSRPMPGRDDRFAVTVHDVTARRENEAQLRRLALEDPLTGLANRSLLMDRLAGAVDRAARHGRSLAVLMLDLDHFKDINDTFGHGVGDEVLVAVGRRLRGLFRTTDTVARLGGDEFVVIVDDTDVHQVARTAGRVLASMVEPISVGGRRTRLGVSLGVRLADGGDDAETVLRDADTALYESKRAGRGRITVFDDELGENTRRRVRLGTELERAIDGDQLVLHYQPLYDERSLELLGVEALVRWQHPELGLLGPFHFVPQAEESGLIGALGAWVLEEAWDQLLAWQELREGGLSMSVNVSRGQLQDRGIVDHVLRMMIEKPLDPRLLWFEITESSVTGEGAATVHEVLEELRGLGIRIAIDDFGTGESSLASLRELAIDALKVDRRFVTGVADDRRKADLLAAVLAMGRALDLRVLTEGVETEDELAQLRRTDPGGARRRFVQGYLLSRPVEAAEITRMLSRPDGGRGLLPADRIATH